MLSITESASRILLFFRVMTLKKWELYHLDFRSIRTQTELTARSEHQHYTSRKERNKTGYVNVISSFMAENEVKRCRAHYHLDVIPFILVVLSYSWFLFVSRNISHIPETLNWSVGNRTVGEVSPAAGEVQRSFCIYPYPRSSFRRLRVRFISWYVCPAVAVGLGALRCAVAQPFQRYLFFWLAFPFFVCVLWNPGTLSWGNGN